VKVEASAAPPGFTLSPSSFALAPEEKAVVEIRFRPEETKAYEGTISFRAGESSAEVRVEGVGVPPGDGPPVEPRLRRREGRQRGGAPPRDREPNRRPPPGGDPPGGRPLHRGSGPRGSRPAGCGADPRHLRTEGSRRGVDAPGAAPVLRLHPHHRPGQGQGRREGAPRLAVSRGLRPRRARAHPPTGVVDYQRRRLRRGARGDRGRGRRLRRRSGRPARSPRDRRASIRVEFEPRRAGDLEAELVVRTTVIEQRELRVPLSGIGWAPVPCTLRTPDRVRFGAVASNSALPRSMVVKNEGAEACPLWGFEVGGPDADAFSIELPAKDPMVLEAGQSASLQVFLRENAPWRRARSGVDPSARCAARIPDPRLARLPRRRLLRLSGRRARLGLARDVSGRRSTLPLTGSIPRR